MHTNHSHIHIHNMCSIFRNIRHPEVSVSPSKAIQDHRRPRGSTENIQFPIDV